MGPEGASNQVISKLRTAIPQVYPGARVDAGESVSGKVSGELAADSAKAIIFAMLGIALYIWFRFEWQFGVGALLTLSGGADGDRYEIGLAGKASPSGPNSRIVVDDQAPALDLGVNSQLPNSQLPKRVSSKKFLWELRSWELGIGS